MAINLVEVNKEIMMQRGMCNQESFNSLTLPISSKLNISLLRKPNAWVGVIDED